MSFNAATLKLMADKGLSAHDIAEIAAMNEVRRDPGAAERMSKMRARRKAATPVTVTPNVTRNPSPNEYILTPTHENPTKPIGLDRPAKKHRLPIDWEPQPFKPGTVAALTVIRWEPGRLERELAKFRDHHTAAGTKWENWQAAWSKWANGSQDFGGRNHGQQHHSNRPSQTAVAYAILNP